MDIQDISMLLQTCAPHVHQQTMAAIVKTESGFKPFAIGINKSEVKLARQPANKQEAVTTAKWLISNGYNIDMGMAQINSANMKWLGVSVDDLFDPCKNVSAGAKILLNNYVDAFKKIGEPQNALRAALSSYNTGNATAGIKNGYVAKVTAASVTVPALLVQAPKAPEQAPPIALVSKLPTSALTTNERSTVTDQSPSGINLVASAAATVPAPAKTTSRPRSGEFVYSVKADSSPETAPENTSPMVFR